MGFLRAAARLFGNTARFVSLGGIDVDPGACADFEYLTGSPALCTDIARMQPAELRAFAGPRAPDVAFASAPCKSFSGLIDPRLASSPEYVAMSRLYVTGVELLLSTWDVPPRLILMENVPRILSKGAHLIAEVTELLEAAGYAVHISSYDCGELGGLAQHRRRALLVARLVRRVPALLYQPSRLPVRACGDVLGELPLPETPSAGPMHRMPRIGWATWVRLALIPAGGDHRDLPGVLDKLQARREVWARHHVEAWGDPSGTVTTEGTNGAYGVADPRVTFELGDSTYTNICAVTGWDDAARTVAGATRPASGAPSVADPRVAPWFPGALGVVRWHDPTGTITGGGVPSKGAFSVADVRMHRSPGRNPDHALGVRPWGAPSYTIAGQGTNPGTGAYAVGDPRITAGVSQVSCDPRAGAYGVISWQEAAKTITAAGQIDNGPFAIADPRAPDVQPVAIVDNPKRSPFIVVDGKRVKVPVVILAEDGTWHRPMTPLELARLQDFPAQVDGAPLRLHGDNVGAWVERIGNAVPVGTARAIAEQMLLTLLASDVGAGLLPSGGAVWVQPGFDLGQASQEHRAT
jgi:site-specific DNA-cytosine methylase